MLVNLYFLILIIFVDIKINVIKFDILNLNICKLLMIYINIKTLFNNLGKKDFLRVIIFIDV